MVGLSYFYKKCEKFSCSYRNTFYCIGRGVQHLQQGWKELQDGQKQGKGIYVSFYLSISILYINVTIYRFIYNSISIFRYLSIYLYTFSYLFIYIYLIIYLPIYLSFFTFTYLSIYLCSSDIYHSLGCVRCRLCALRISPGMVVV